MSTELFGLFAHFLSLSVIATGSALALASGMHRHAQYVSNEQLQLIHCYLASFSKGPAAKEIAPLQAGAAGLAELNRVIRIGGQPTTPFALGLYFRSSCARRSTSPMSAS